MFARQVGQLHVILENPAQKLDGGVSGREGGRVEALVSHPPGRISQDMDEQDKPLPPEAVRALEEAEARRKATRSLDLPPELGGRDGPEPVRYGDWEKKGIAIDF